MPTTRETTYLVDDDFNMTGIIDWEWVHTAPPELAFDSPVGLLPVANFCDGENSLGTDEQVFTQMLEGKGKEKSGTASAPRPRPAPVRLLLWLRFGGRLGRVPPMPPPLPHRLP